MAHAHSVSFTSQFEINESIALSPNISFILSLSSLHLSVQRIIPNGVRKHTPLSSGQDRFSDWCNRLSRQKYNLQSLIIHIYNTLLLMAPIYICSVFYEQCAFIDRSSNACCVTCIYGFNLQFLWRRY